MATDISPIFQKRLAHNRGLVPGHPEATIAAEYGVLAEIDGAEISLTLTFRTGFAYCCMEWGCHLGFTSPRSWNWLRGELAAIRMAPPERLRVNLTIIVEDGALFFDLHRPAPNPAKRSWYHFAPHTRHTFEAHIIESSSQSSPKVGD